MATDTTDPSYWLTITFFLCAAGVLVLIVIASILIWKFEVSRNREGRENQVSTRRSFLSADEPWKTCLNKFRPGWLMTYRIFAFSVLLALLLTNVMLDGGGIFLFYTQWTFTLVTCYFGLGSVLSIYGCWVYDREVSGARVNMDAEQGNYVALSLESNPIISNSPKVSNIDENSSDLPKAGFLVYVFQIMYQTSAGAVLLTDTVFWLILYPFLMDPDYKLNFLDVCLHSLNAVFLLGDSFLNSLTFPFFRIAYFLLWTSIYVIFQWIIHACISMGWPYPFLDLSVKSAPFWYLGVAAMQIPCYGIFALAIQLKHFWLSRSFPESYQS